MALTPEQRAAIKLEYAKKALKAMHGYYSEYAALPSYAEITERMGFSAKSWAYECVRRLVETGHVMRLPSGRLAPGDRFFDGL